MLRIAILLLFAVLPACRSSQSPFAAASGVTRPDAAAEPFRVVPLRAMSGDVEILYGDPEKAGEPFAMRIREADAAKTFTFKRGDRVHTPGGPGAVRNGYASGEIIQYEIAAEDGSVFMANQDEMQLRER